MQSDGGTAQSAAIRRQDVDRRLAALERAISALEMAISKEPAIPLAMLDRYERALTRAHACNLLRVYRLRPV